MLFCANSRPVFLTPSNSRPTPITKFQLSNNYLYFEVDKFRQTTAQIHHYRKCPKRFTETGCEVTASMGTLKQADRLARGGILTVLYRAFSSQVESLTFARVHEICKMIRFKQTRRQPAARFNITSSRMLRCVGGANFLRECSTREYISSAQRIY